MFLNKIILLLIFTFYTLYAFEQRGVSVKMTLKNGTQKKVIVKREIPKECKEIPIDNETLWSGDFANEKVPQACKSTYVHTKGKLLPMQLDEEVETYGELEVLATLKQMQDSDSIVLIDSRKKKWFDYMSIPGAINIPFYYFKERSHYEFHCEYALKYLGVEIKNNGEYDFTHAKILVLFCNGPWCSQSPKMIFALLEIGYPPKKLKWYRGGMQDWLSAGMTSTRSL